MILGIMQPYFFPYIGYYDLIDRSDKWVVFDIVQYHPRSWMNRNRILHPSNGWQYVTVPVHRPSSTAKIMEITVPDKTGACSRILGQIDHYRGRAPFFSEVAGLIKEVFSRSSTDRLAELNLESLKLTCDYLGISIDYSICSELNLLLPEIKHPGQWALEICSLMKAEVYINPPGGKEIFRDEEWMERNIRLEFIDVPRFEYADKPFRYIENLSILDVLMWNSAEEIMEKLRSARLNEK